MPGAQRNGARGPHDGLRAAGTFPLSAGRSGGVHSARFGLRFARSDEVGGALGDHDSRRVGTVTEIRGITEASTTRNLACDRASRAAHASNATRATNPLKDGNGLDP